MLKILGVFFLVFISSKVCTAWNSRACFVDHVGYIQKILQETMYEVEKNVKFCNLKVKDFNQTINDQMYRLHVQGVVQYTNSFLISIENMDVDSVSAAVGRRVIVATNATEYEALVRASLNLRLPRIGFDVRMDLQDKDVQHYTGLFEYDSITYQFWILKNLNTNITTVSTVSAGQSSRFQKMQLLPNTAVGQVLSRHVAGFDMANSLTTWGQDILVPIIQKLADTKIPFPEVRFDAC